MSEMTARAAKLIEKAPAERKPLPPIKTFEQAVLEVGYLALWVAGAARSYAMSAADAYRAGDADRDEVAAKAEVTSEVAAQLRDLFARLKAGADATREVF